MCITKSYVAYDVSYRIELLSIPYNATKSYAAKSQRVYWALSAGTKEGYAKKLQLLCVTKHLKVEFHSMR